MLRALLVAHPHGGVCDQQEEEAVPEDAKHAVGVDHKGRPAGKVLKDADTQSDAWGGKRLCF